MYRVMPYAYPPVVGGQQGGAGTDPEPTERLPYEFADDFAITWGSLIGKTISSGSGMGSTAPIFMAPTPVGTLSGLTVLNSDLAGTTAWSITGTATDIAYDLYVDGKKTGTGTTKFLSLSKTPDKLDPKIYANYRGIKVTISSADTGKDKWVKITSDPKITVSKITIRGPDGTVLQEWTP